MNSLQDKYYIFINSVSDIFDKLLKVNEEVSLCSPYLFRFIQGVFKYEILFKIKFFKAESGTSLSDEYF